MHVSETAAAFGFSRPSFYKAQEHFAQAGRAGLIPRKRGPKQRRKLNAACHTATFEIEPKGKASAIRVILNFNL